MKKNYVWSFLAMALFFVFISCNQDESESEVIQKTVVEPDFFESDGSVNLEEERLEEEAPIEVGGLSAKSYYYSYTLLKPSELNQTKVNEIKCGETKRIPLLVGARKKQVGVVKVSNDEENLYLTVKAGDSKYLKKVYFNIGAKEDIPFYSNGYPNLYKFNYKAFPYYFGGQKKATYVIPLSSIDSNCFEIVAYAKVFDKSSWCYYSAFGYDANLTQKYSYSSYSGCYYFKDWVRSFEYCKNDCTPTYPTYAVCDGTKRCFTEDGFTNWGWTNGPYYERFGFALYANAENCDEEQGVQVGQMSFRYDHVTRTGTLRFVTYAPYILKSTYAYVGAEKYPLDANGEASNLPSDYPFQHINLVDDGSPTVDVIELKDIDDPGTGFYVIGYADVVKSE